MTNEQKTAESALDESLYTALMEPRFRGEIYDYARFFELGFAYKIPSDNLCRDCRSAGRIKCRHFEIDSARQLIGPFKAIRDSNVRTVMVLKATQTLGSLVWDLTLHWMVVHSPYTTIVVYLDIDEKARKYCDERLMPALKKNPDIAKLLPKGSDRFDATKTVIRFTNGKSIVICGLNESNASSLSKDVVIIDEGWLHHSDGLMQKAIDRTKQVPDRKVIIIGQAGLRDEDQDKIWNSLAKRVPLTFECPKCKGRQEFSVTAARPKDFKPILVEGQQPPIPDTYYGLTVKERFNEIKDVKEAAKYAYYECYHCGYQILDTPANRKAMMETYRQDYQENGITPPDYSVGFWNPDPASVTIPFSQTMEAYIHAKKVDANLGNKVPLQDFYQNRWATAWDERLVRALRQRNQEVYDVEMAKHDAWRLCMIVDNQLDLMSQWVMVNAVKKDGSVRQLWRGALRGLNECRAKQLEYKTETGKMLIPDQFVFLDGRYKPENIRRHIFENKYGHWTNYHGERTWMAWNLMQGSYIDYFTHEDEKDKMRKFVVGDPNYHAGTIDGYYAEILTFPFSRTACGQRFEANRDGKGVATLFLDRQEGEPPDDHELSHHSQIHSNKLVESKAFAPRASKLRYVPVPASAPEHYWDCWLIQEAIKEMWGVDGVYLNANGETKPVATNPA